MNLYATYDLTTRRIIGWHQSNCEQSADDCANTGARMVPGPRPPFSPQGYVFDEDFNICPFEPGLAEHRLAKRNEAADDFAARMAAGFTCSGALFQIDGDSQQNITAMGALALSSVIDPTANPWPGDFYWIAADNSHVAMDAAATLAFARSVATYVSSCILRLRAIKDAIAAAADEAALEAIDVTAGYPAASA